MSGLSTQPDKVGQWSLSTLRPPPSAPPQCLWIRLCNGQPTVEYDFLFKNLPMRVLMHHLQEQDRWKLKTCGRPVHILTIWDGGEAVGN